MIKKGDYILYYGRLWEVLEDEWCDEILDNMGYTINYYYNTTIFNAELKDKKPLRYVADKQPFKTLNELKYYIKIKNENQEKLKKEIDIIEQEKNRLNEKINIFKSI